MIADITRNEDRGMDRLTLRERDCTAIEWRIAICSWCKRYYDRQTHEIVAPPPSAPGRRYTHGICEGCLAEQKALLSKQV